MKGLILSLMMLLALGVLPATAAKRPETMRVQINKEKRFAKGRLSIRFVELVEDSRCPTDTNCIWAGNAKIRIRVAGYGRSQELTLDTNGQHQSATAEGYSIKLISLTPAPRSNIRINRNGYVATFEAVKLSR
jgi:hypothetical protein